MTQNMLTTFSQHNFALESQFIYSVKNKSDIIDWELKNNALSETCCYAQVWQGVL